MVNLNDALGGISLYQDQELRKWAIQIAASAHWDEEAQDTVKLAQKMFDFVKGEEDAG